MKYIFLINGIFSVIMEYYCLYINNNLMTISFGFIGFTNIMIWIYLGKKNNKIT